MLIGPATLVMLASLQLAAARSVAPIEGSELRSCVAMHTVGEMRIHLAVVVVLLVLPAAAVELRWPEATLRGFPLLRDTNGRPVGDSSVSQWIEHGALHVKAVHDFRDGRRVEQRGNEVLRRFEADMVGRSAMAQKKEENGELKHWEESLEIEPGKTFACVGFMYAFPPTLLRAEIALAEPSDPIIRIDALPAASSAEARAPPPAARRARAVHPGRDQQK